MSIDNRDRLQSVESACEVTQTNRTG